MTISVQTSGETPIFQHSQTIHFRKSNLKQNPLNLRTLRSATRKDGTRKGFKDWNHRNQEKLEVSLMMREGLTRRPFARVFLFALAVLGIFCVVRLTTIKADDDDKLKSGKFIPTGVQITPDAAPGTTFQPLNPGLCFDPKFRCGASRNHRGEP
jgi:hypothetical protein